MIDNDGERQNVRNQVTYASDVEAQTRGRGQPRAIISRSRSRSRHSMSFWLASRNVDPAIVLPPHFRTLSFGIEDNKRRSPAKDVKPQTPPTKATEIEFGDIDYHTAPVEELVTRFSSPRSIGLTSAQASQKLRTVGANTPSPPPSQWLRKTLGSLFGGFRSILLTAAILVFIAWKTLGRPPALVNLALAIVLVIVWAGHASFSFWQDFSTSRVMASIIGMLPDRCIVLRDGTQQQVDGRGVVPGGLHWFLGMTFGTGLLLLDEGRKLSVRRFPKSSLTKLAW